MRKEFNMGIRGLTIMKFNQYMIIAEYNGKADFSFKVTAKTADDAMRIAKDLVSKRYELRVIT